MKKIVPFALSTILALSCTVTSFAYDNTDQLNTEFNLETIAETDTVVDFDTFDGLSFENNKVRGTSLPTSQFTGTTYTISGKSNDGTILFTNNYFKNVVGKPLKITAGPENDIMVNLVHRGIIFDEVTKTWAVSKSSTSSISIKTSDLNGFSSSDGYYFRFRPNTAKKAYSVTSTFN